MIQKPKLLLVLAIGGLCLSYPATISIEKIVSEISEFNFSDMNTNSSEDNKTTTTKFY